MKLDEPFFVDPIEAQSLCTFCEILLTVERTTITIDIDIQGGSRFVFKTMIIDGETLVSHSRITFDRSGLDYTSTIQKRI